MSNGPAEGTVQGLPKGWNQKRPHCCILTTLWTRALHSERPHGPLRAFSGCSTPHIWRLSPYLLRLTSLISHRFIGTPGLTKCVCRRYHVQCKTRCIFFSFLCIRATQFFVSTMRKAFLPFRLRNRGILHISTGMIIKKSGKHFHRINVFFAFT